MKNIFILTLLISFISNSQTTLSLYDDEYGTVDGAYYKDIHNDFDNFTGTWMYSNDNTSFTIILQKKEKVSTTYGKNNIFEDVVIGGYRYIQNGVEKVNTLPQLLLELPNIIQYNIIGNSIIGPGTVYCKDCGLNDRKIWLLFNDPTCEIIGLEPYMLFQRADQNGVQRLKLKFSTGGHMIVEEGVDPPCTEYKVPFGEYILVKQ